jgi:translation initiation factor IF-3
MKPENRLDNRKVKNENLRVNGQIRLSPVVVIDQEGENLGSMPLQMALGIASEAGLDLVEISPSSRPPVCRVVDYGKFKFNQNLKEKKLKKKQSKASKMKEVRLSPSIQKHDIETKRKSAISFLESGQRVNIRLEFRRREIVHQSLGHEMMKSFLDGISDFGTPVSRPKTEGRAISCVVEPKIGSGKSIKDIQQNG